MMPAMAGTQDSYRAAVIGLGFIGAGDEVSAAAIGQRVRDLGGSVHAEVLAAHPRTLLCAGASREEGRRDRFRKRFGGRPAVYEDFRRMLREEKPDIVGIAASSPAHAEIAVACAEAGVRAVLCEKPLATRLSDADRMIAACAARGALLAVNHNRRWHPVYLAARGRIASGALGDLRTLWARWATGRLGCVGTHVFDALCLLTGRRPEAVAGELDAAGTPDCRGPAYRDPGGWGTVLFEGGVRAHIDAGEDNPKPAGIEIRIEGTLGRMTVRDAGFTREDWSGGAGESYACPPGIVTLRGAVDEIVRWMDQGGSFSSSGADGRTDLEIIMGFHASHGRGGQRVPLPLAGADREIEVMIG
jgi:predicted dehydrogenase